MPPTRFRFLGLPHIELHQSRVPLAASRPHLLLAYLAVTGAWQGRDQIARVFWPDRSDKIARSNLRNLLCKLPPYAALEATEHALRLKARSDLQALEEALQRGDWLAAARMGSRDLLEGFESGAPEPYLQWLRTERDLRLGAWKQALQALLDRGEAPLEMREAWAEAWAQRCPLDEEAARAKVALAHERHRPVAAAAIYRAFEQRLRSELGVDPSADLESLALRRIPPAADAAQALPEAPRSPRGVTASPARARLVGRRHEMRQLAALLDEETARLVTVTGPGGVGKSALLAAFFEQAQGRPDADAFFVDVGSAPHAAAAMAGLASALGVKVSPGEDGQAALADALGVRRWLLVVDGAEQPGWAEPLAFLLERCPQTRWLIASRHRLHLEAEQLLALEGFPLPDADEADAQLLGANDGVCFLADAMAKAGRPVNLAREGSTLGAIVRAVDGLPLALRLLGRLSRLFAPAQLLEGLQVARAPGTLPAQTLSMSELLPSLLASFQRSWLSLSLAEQTVLARLSVFPADFEIDAARWVARAELPVITALVDRSLLRALGAGRLSLHAAIRSCVQAQCPQPPRDAVPDFLAYYAERLRGAASLARTRTVRPLMRLMAQERQSLEHAWAWALERRDQALLLSLQESVWFLDDGTSSTMQFSARCANALRVLREAPAGSVALHALLLGGAARDHLNHVRLTEAIEHAREALRLARRARHFDASVQALNVLFYAHVTNRNFRQAELLRQQHDALLRRVDEGVLAYWPLEAAAMLALLERRELDAVIDAWTQCARLAHGVEDEAGEMHYLVNAAMSCYRLDAPDRALSFEDRAFALGAATQVDPAAQAKWLSEFAHWHIELSRLDRARAYTERAVALSSTHPQMQVLRLKVRLAQAALHTASGELEAARPHLMAVLAPLAQDDLPPISGTALVTAGRWLHAAGRMPDCRAALQAAWDYRAANGHDLRVARRLLGELGVPPPEERPREGLQPSLSLAAAQALQGIVAARQAMPQAEAAGQGPGDG